MGRCGDHVSMVMRRAYTEYGSEMGDSSAGAHLPGYDKEVIDGRPFSLLQRGYQTT